MNAQNRGSGFHMLDCEFAVAVFPFLDSGKKQTQFFRQSGTGKLGPLAEFAEAVFGVFALFRHGATCPKTGLLGDTHGGFDTTPLWVYTGLHEARNLSLQARTD